MSTAAGTRYRWLILGGVAVGAVVFGLGSRIAMRFVGILASPEHLGQPTEFGVVGKVTFAGTAGLVVFGAVAGLITGLAYLLIRPWLPAGWALRGLALGLLLLSPVGVFIVASSKSDFDLTSTTAIFAAFAGMILLEGLATIFVPRVLWPDKPRYMPGAWFTWYLGYAASPETATTATAMMLPTELYWMFGLLGVVLGMAFLAVLYFVVWERLRRLSRAGLLPMLALFALLARSAGMEGVHTIYAVSAPVILLAYVIIFDWLQKVLMPGLSVRPVPSARP